MANLTQTERNEEIRALFKGGESLKDIGKRYGISGSRVGQIVGTKKDKKQSKRPKKALTQPKTTPRNEQPQEEIDHKFEQDVAYFFGRVEAQLEIFASVAGYSRADVAVRVGELLSRSHMGKVVRAGHKLPRVR